jgi:sigma-B regulation protein RsbU (phosphoserine phosphatase)
MEIKKDKILIVEDDPDTLFILNRILAAHNFEVKTATDGTDALATLENYNPKVIVADWTMPELDGLQLCKILKEDEKYKMIYFIILTARSSLEDRVVGLDSGADDFLIKPIENQELLARIRSGVRIFNLQNELKTIEHKKAVIELACTIGHQFNNPLSSLLLSIDNIQHKTKENPKLKISEDLEIINLSLQKIKSLVDTLLKIENPETIQYSQNQQMIKL